MEAGSVRKRKAYGKKITPATTGVIQGFLTYPPESGQNFLVFFFNCIFIYGSLP
jgi:hypothetical protein